MSTKPLKTRKPRKQKLARRTRSKLKKAALDLFSEKAVDAATIDEITEKADVGKGTLYQHFSDKESIVVTLVEEAVDHLSERICSYAVAPKSLEQMLEHLLKVHYDFLITSEQIEESITPLRRVFVKGLYAFLEC